MRNRILLSFGKMPRWNCHANGTIFARGLRLPVVKLLCKWNNFSKRFDIWILFWSHVNLLLTVSQTKSRRYVCGSGYHFFFLLIIWGKVLGEHCLWFIVNLQLKNIRWRLACNDAEQAITHGWNVPEATPNKCSKEKPPSWRANSDTDSHSVVLDSVNFHLK